MIQKPEYKIKRTNIKLVNLPSHCKPCLHAPHNNEPQWSQKVKSLYVCTINLCGTFILKRFSGTILRKFL